jgi:adenine-specific DNA-methyltransferase
LLDEIFEAKNFLALIQYRTSVPLASSGLAGVTDYILWYSKDRSATKYYDLFVARETGEKSRYSNLELPDGSRRALTKDEKKDLTKVPENSRLISDMDLASSGYTDSCTYPFEYNGKIYRTSSGKSWKTTEQGMRRLALANRITDTGKTIRYVLYLDDYPVTKLTNLWSDTTGELDKSYAVQTHTKMIERCMLMTTDPGDLVLDPTCGSGTTAFTAEQWGRRWITCDTSRVAVTLAKQRLMTAVFDYYTLAHPKEGVGSGFKYKTVPHVTLKSIANNPEIVEGMSREEIDAAIKKYADQEVLYDQPEVDRSKARVTGPFTYEAVPAINVREIDEPDSHGPIADPMPADASISRSGVTSRQDEWRDELARTGVRGKGGTKLEFLRLEPLPGTRYLHAVGETKDKQARTVAVSFGPEHAPLEQRHVELAWEEARGLKPKPEVLLFAAFHFDPEAAKDIDELDPQKAGMQLLKLQMNTDLLTDDLKKKRSSNESFWLVGQPDVTLRKIHRGQDSGLWEVEVHGFDYYNPSNGKIESGDTSRIAMWLLDTDYDGRSLLPRQVFFPMSGEKDGWSRLSKNLKAEIDEDLIEAYRGTISLPFDLGKNRRIAAKIIDDRGIECLKIINMER